ncbi:MAG: FKBP-type peptidyl-prolyl cis-trans isomerase [Rhodoferax sp.]
MTTTPAQVQPGSFLTLHYRLSGPQGSVVSTFEGKPATLTLGGGQLAPALEQCLLGLGEGAQAAFDLPAGAVFGERNASMQQWLDAKELRAMGEPDEEYAVGDVVHFPTPDGQGKFAGVVLALRHDAAGALQAAQFDFNHPLAGQSVRFEVQILGVL